MVNKSKFQNIFIKCKHTFCNICREINEFRETFESENNKKTVESVWTIFCWNFEVWAVQMYVNLVDLVKSFPTSISYFTCKIGFDTAERERKRERALHDLCNEGKLEGNVCVCLINCPHLLFTTHVFLLEETAQC